MRRTIALFKGSKGTGWYQKYINDGPESFIKYVPPTPFDWGAGNVQRPKAYFSVKLEDEDIGKMVFELADDVVPQTVDNFIRLCEGQSRRYEGYRNTKIHLIRKGEVLMGGDIESRDGSGNHSSYDVRYFEDENFIIPHSDRGMIRYV